MVLKIKKTPRLFHTMEREQQLVSPLTEWILQQKLILILKYLN